VPAEFRVQAFDIQLPEKRGFGTVFQSSAQLPPMSVLDNVGFELKMREHVQ